MVGSCCRYPVAEKHHISVEGSMVRKEFGIRDIVLTECTDYNSFLASTSTESGVPPSPA